MSKIIIYLCLASLTIALVVSVGIISEQEDQIKYLRQKCR